MSLVVLNSQGQDPAEWENHFGRGLKLPKNAEICLCGVNLNKWEKEEGANIIQDINDAFIVNWGRADDRGYLPYGGYLVKLKSGNYTATSLGGALANALAVGNYYTSFTDGNFSDIPISCLRLGLLGSYDAANNAMKFTCDRQFIRGESPVNLGDWLGTCGRESGPNLHTSLGIGMTIAPFGSDDTFVNWRVTEHTRAILNTRALWNGSNGAGILQPATGAMGGAVANRITPLPEFGYTWGLVLDGTQPYKEVMGFRGGIFRENKQIGVNAASGYNTFTERMNREDLRNNWAAGGIAYDLYWEIERFTQAGATPDSGSFDFSIYYVPIGKAGAFNKKLSKSDHIKVGGGRLSTGTGAAPNWCQISFRPVDGKGGTDANAPQATAAGDRDKCCIDFRHVRGTPLAGVIAGASVAGAIAPANAAGTGGYVAITDDGDFDLYKGAPIYMGGDWRKVDLTVGNAIPAQTMLMKGIYHDMPTTALASMSAINANPAYVTAPAVIADMEFSFLNINFAFSPLLESTNVAFTKMEFVSTANRWSNIASAIGFREGKYHTLTSANSSTGLSSDYKDAGWNDKETLCVVQLPNMPIDGELGGGSGNFGGANTAQILGVVGLRSDTSEVTGSVYREPMMENWIKCKNLGHFAINQLKVKLTDTTGRKLKCLQPESTIWIKIRECKNDGGIRTGGVNPISKPDRMLERGYNSFY